MTEDDKAWQRNTPEKRAERRAAWGSWCERQEQNATERRPEGYQRERWK